MTQVIDRRLNGKHKSAVNRQRFLHRFKKQIKHAVNEAINKRSIIDIEGGEKIIIPAKDINEPKLYHDYGGLQERVYPGNKEFLRGDHIARPNQSGAGGNSEASDSGAGVDDFGFTISKAEFLEILFDDLALPALIKKQISQIPTYKIIRAGYTTSGMPTNINIRRSFKGAISRRIAIGNPHKKALQQTENELEDLLKTPEPNETQIKDLQDKITELKRKITVIPFLDTFDLRYNNRIKQLMPTTQAVMFCIMDVSGSMDKIKKDIAKRFFILLYLFLTRNYEKIDVIFIRHHTSAKEVNEEEFFYSRETGGTVVSSALQLMQKIIEDRYQPSIWNIYAAQASDGDNWNADSPHCAEVLCDHIMPKMQYFAYVEIMPRLHQSLWETYLDVKTSFPNFAMQTINDLKDIYPVFRELFKRQLA